LAKETVPAFWPNSKDMILGSNKIEKKEKQIEKK
jgi:hypothetical protein